MRAPRESRLSRRARSAASGAALRGAGSATPSLVADKVGTYRLGLTVTASDGSTGSDVTEARIDPVPAAYVSTHEQQGGQWGILISTPTGNAFYPGDVTKWLQVLVLDRRDLSLVLHKQYDCPQATDNPRPSQIAAVGPCQLALVNDLRSLPDRDNKLLVATSQSSPSASYDVQPPNGANAVGAHIWDWWDRNVPIKRGTFSAIGTLTEQKVARASTDQTGLTSGGEIRDLLVLDNENRYSLAPGPLQFDTQAPGSDAEHSVMQIAGNRYGEPLSANSTSGFHVVIAHPDTLQGTSYFFRTAGINTDSQQLQGLLNVLKQANDDGSSPNLRKKLIFMTSRNRPAVFPADATVNDLLAAVGNEIVRAGGTRSRFFAAMDPRKAQNNSYTLVSSGQTQATEVLGPPQPVNNPVTNPVRGMLARTGTWWNFEVQSAGVTPVISGDPSIGAGQMFQTAGQAPSTWPEQGNPGRTAAIKFIGQQIFGTEQPRTQYWTISWTPGRWAPVITSVNQLCTQTPLPDQCKNLQFSPDDLGWAKGEIVKELGWLEQMHQYLNDLASPFLAADWGWADLSTVANLVQSKVQISDGSQRVDLTTEAGLEWLVEASEQVPVVGNFVSVAHSSYSFATRLARAADVPIRNDFQSSVATAGTDLETRYKAAQSLLTDQIPNVIVSDYAKLKLVGSCASINAQDHVDCPFNRGDWEFTDVDRRPVAAALRQASQVALFGALLPAKYGVYRLPENPHTTANDYYATDVIVFGCQYPFKGSPASAQLAMPTYPAIYTGGGLVDRYEIRTLGFETGGGVLGNAYVMNTPTADATDTLFGTGAGQLGANQEEFFNRFLPAGADLRAYPYNDTQPQWWQQTKKGCGPKAASGAPPRVPRTVALSQAVRSGIPVNFDVGNDRSIAELTLFLGGRRTAGGSALRSGSVLARDLLRERSVGRHTARLTIRPSTAGLLRRTRRHAATLRLRLTAPGGRTVTTYRAITVRY